jgi:zinc transporter ZupT
MVCHKVKNININFCLLGISKVRPVGWMAIFGDGIGNLIDGLTIGASISQNLTLGVTNSLACWLGNIPQELGKPVFFNFYK